MKRRSKYLLGLAALLAAPLQAQDAEWTPLSGARFGAELGEKWIPVPNGDSGAPRQGWLATADGFFTREAHLAYDYVEFDGGGAHEVLARFNHPLSRRLWAGIEVPFYQRAGGRSDFGDVSVNTLVMLAETRNLSVNAGVGWRLPTGSVRLGNNVFAAQPQINLWSDVGGGLSLRGRVGYEFTDSGRADALVLNAAIGQTVTPHDRAPLGDLTWYVAGNWREPSQRRSFVSVTPGVRTHVGGNLFFLAGVEFPLTDRDASFDRRYIVQLVQGF
ncbi:transporter [Glacieibacterium frigidum]|uniref:Transporter n=1 Tax=Glacieibacterium frigidum TaxID=2593303 RepID=A0A552UH75_9SPHN|nr:transporter [Glacieibacterium frigidum]TRW17541.1 transporter [Glacieibacterium frigidum]